MKSDQHSRRRFLSGSAAVPVILTVQSGSAVAATSSACKIRDAAATQPTLLPNQPGQSISGPSPDEWVRRNVQLVKVKLNGTVVKSNGVAVVFFRNRAGTYYYQFNGDNVTPTLLNTIGAPRPPGQVIGQTVEEILVTTNGVRSALIRVDSAGSEVGFFWETSTGGQKITKSCWTSFNTGA